MIVQVEFLKDYHYSEGVTKRRGYRTLLDSTKAIPLIKAGYCKEFTEYDLRMQARNEMISNTIKNEAQLIQPEYEKEGWWDRIKKYFKI